MAQQVKGLAAKPSDPSSIPRIYMVEGKCDMPNDMPALWSGEG